MDKLRLIFSLRSEMGPPPELHMYFNQIPKNFPTNFPNNDFTEQHLADILSKIEEANDDIDLRLKKSSIQMQTRDQDAIYYQKLREETESEINKCKREITELQVEL